MKKNISIILIILLIIGIALAIFYKNQNKPAEGPSVDIEIPDASKRTVKLYYYNPSLDKDKDGNILCSDKGLVEVIRKIPLTEIPIQDTLKLLLKGEIREEEKALGVTTEYPLEGFELEGADLKKSQLTLFFKDPNYKTGGGSCRANILWLQIEKTAKQFPEVDSVKFMPEELFQP